MATTVEIETFRHEQLPDASTCIRLLEVISVDDTRDIKVHCKVTTWRKASAPTYTAISYTWGDPTLVTVVLVNEKRLEVRRNCEDVLSKPCLNKGGYFWIDAICINQADKDEKSSQVASMGDVFKDATQTLACVGRNENDSKFLFESLRKDRNFWHLFYWGTHVVSSRRIRCWRRLRRKTTIARLYNALSKFLKRPYFQRVWIYQELFFGRNIHVCCEDETAEVSLFWGLYVAFESWPMDDNKLLKGVDRSRLEEMHDNFRFILHTGVSQGKRLSLLRMIRVVKVLQSEDPRDRVFGTLATINWEGRKPIQPDYTKDPFDLAVEVLQRIGNVDFDDRFIPEAIRVAQLLGLTANPSSRLADEIQARRSKHPEAPTVCQARTVQEGDSIPMSSIFWAKHIYFHNESWQVQPSPLKGADGSSEPILRSSESLLPSLIPTSNLKKWCKGHFWDVEDTDILLPQEVQPQDWVLIPSAIGRLDHIAHLAFIGRDIDHHRLQVVGKALVIGWKGRPTKPTWTNEAAKFKVYIDPRDALVLAYSCNWKDMETGLLSKKDEPHMLFVDDYFETKLCGEGSHSYGILMDS